MYYLLRELEQAGLYVSSRTRAKELPPARRAQGVLFVYDQGPARS
jgi:hypothetical protein